MRVTVDRHQAFARQIAAHVDCRLFDSGSVAPDEVIAKMPMRGGLLPEPVQSSFQG